MRLPLTAPLFAATAVLGLASPGALASAPDRATLAQAASGDNSPPAAQPQSQAPSGTPAGTSGNTGSAVSGSSSGATGQRVSRPAKQRTTRRQTAQKRTTRRATAGFGEAAGQPRAGACTQLRSCYRSLSRQLCAPVDRNCRAVFTAPANASDARCTEIIAGVEGIAQRYFQASQPAFRTPAECRPTAGFGRASTQAGSRSGVSRGAPASRRTSGAAPTMSGRSRNQSGKATGTPGGATSSPGTGSGSTANPSGSQPSSGGGGVDGH